MKTINEQLSNFTVELQLEDIPEKTKTHLKKIMLDGYGCALYGSTTQAMQIYQKVLKKMTDRKEASIWGCGEKTSVINAMMLNGSAVNSFEIDDTHTEGIIHVNTGVLGCITAFAEHLGTMSGKDFLTAAALAFEISCRVAAPVGMEIAHKGFNNSASCCVFGSAAATGKMIGLTREQMQHCFGIAGNWAGGLQAVQFTAMAKRIVPSKTSEGAILGALLAKEGFTGIEDVFENPFGGFYHCFSDSKYDKERVVGKLGELWEIEEIGLKFYSTCRSKHTTIGALQKFMRDNSDVTPEKIEKIVCHTTSITQKYALSEQKITSIVAAQISHPYVCAVTILEGDAFIDQFTEEKLRDPKILEFMKKVEVVTDKEIENLPRSERYTVKVDVHLKDGRIFHLKEIYPKGHPKNFVSDDELLGKFHTVAKAVLKEESVRERLADMILNLERLQNISELTDILRSSPVSV